NVSGSTENSDTKTPPKIAETIKTAKTLEREQANNIKDIVKYETGVTVVEAGRFGQSGFAIRGVDENRVAITVDGVSQAETLSSQGFKELFEGYGNFNNTRNGIEIETLSDAKITKGADSLMSGSGALGGSAIYKTKDARDLLLNKNYAFKYKTGFTSENDERLNSITFAGKANIFDVLAIGTWRNGHEIKNYDYKSADDILGKLREKTDPYNKKDRSLLLKIGTNLGENNRIAVAYDRRQVENKGLDKSYSLHGCTRYVCDDNEIDTRHTHDESIRTSKSIAFENTNVNPLWDTLKLSYTDQRITQRARSDEHCDGERCPGVQNPIGLHYNDDNKLVDKNNSPVTYKLENRSVPHYSFIDESTFNQYSGFKEAVPVELAKEWKLKEYDGIYYIETSFCFKNHGDTNHAGMCRLRSDVKEEKETLVANNITYDLKKEYFINSRITNSDYLLSCDGINCNKNTIQGFEADGTPKDLPIKIIQKEGKKFALIEKISDENGYNIAPEKASRFLVPNSPGYNRNLWKKRDLDTRTQQVNLDLTKYIELAETKHDLSYGLVWSKTTKSMINKEGLKVNSGKWWIDYPKDCESSTSDLCTKNSTASFLIPVETKNGSLYFKDEFRVNNYLGFDIGYRYDKVKYKTNYQPGITPKIPDDMVVNLFIKEPVVKNERSLDPNDPNEINRRKNAEANINYISQPKKFSASSYAFSTKFDPLDWLQIQAKYSKGFRAPTADELYFTFKHPDFTVLPGSQLKAEIAKTKELSLTLHDDEIGFISGGYFITNYDNFIDLDYRGDTDFGSAATGNNAEGASGGQSKYPTYQSVNLAHAKVTGFELKAKFTLGKWVSWLKNVDFGYKLTKQKGKSSGLRHFRDPYSSSISTRYITSPMNAIQPMTQVVSLAYTHPDNLFGLNLYVTHVSQKKKNETYNILSETAENGDKSYVKDKYLRWRSKAYTVTDFTFFVKPMKNLTLRAGIYNLFDKKYITWDSARSIRMFGTSNLINQETGAGINRFYAPGRNYKMSVQFEF
ncbi:TPA: TonB-dependent hemoglobin/transferrin/lactoferrin family receptor, partial [Haemophilus influenzae]